MRRAGWLFDDICSMENFKEAWLKAIRGKSGKPDVATFRADLENNLERLRVSFREGSFGFGRYEYFTISDPKKRLICAASFPERIVHHAMMKTLDQVFERFQISDSYACRKGKGTQAAVLRGFHFVKGKRFFLRFYPETVRNLPVRQRQATVRAKGESHWSRSCSRSHRRVRSRRAHHRHERPQPRCAIQRFPLPSLPWERPRAATA